MPNDALDFLQKLLSPGGQAAARSWQPPVDIYKTSQGWLLKFELAGVDPENIQVSLQDNCITVSGARLDHCIEAGCLVQQMEIAYSSFARRVQLPLEPGRVTVSWDFRNGMLLVRIRQESSS
jgi:HSP20 family protein